MKIQWFPGHMTKTRRLIEENLKLCDIALEIADARLVNSSRSPLLSELISKKPQIIVMNKADIADDKVNKGWEEYFRIQGIKTMFINSRDGGRLLPRITAIINDELKEEIEKWNSRGMHGRTIRVMVTGVPNVGKSTFINNLAGKKSTKTGDRPGVTTGKQWVRAGKLELLDTPGILCPKFDDDEMGVNLAFSGAIRDAVFDMVELSSLLLIFLRDNYKDALTLRYKLPETDGMTGYEILETVCRKRGFIVSGGEVDYERGANIIMDEFRAAKIGRISLERP